MIHKTAIIDTKAKISPSCGSRTLLNVIGPNVDNWR